MVKHILVLILGLQLSGCAFIHNTVNKIWHEGAPPHKTVVIDGASLPSILLVVNGTEDESISTLAKWRKSTLGSFDQIRGAKPNFLSEHEIRVLLNSKLMKFMESDDESMIRIHSLIGLLGFKDGISKDNVASIFNWLADNRTKIRTFYQSFLREDIDADDILTHMKSDAVVNLLQLTGSLVALGGHESLSPQKMADLIAPWVPATLPHVKSSLKPGISFIVSFFASLCGDRVENDLWNGRKIGACLNDISTHFYPAAAVFDFAMGNLNPIDDRAALVEGNKHVVELVTTWMKGHHHPEFPMSRISDYSDSIGIPKPYNYFKLMEWLPKLNPKNTTETFHPDFTIDIAKMVQTWIGTLTTVTAKQSCPDSKWRDCNFTGKYPLMEVISNDEYAVKVRKNDLSHVNRLAMFNSLVQMVFTALDKEKTGYLDNQIGDLITVAVRAVDSHSYLDNVILRLQEKPIYQSSLDETLKPFQKKGLSEVAAMAADLLPKREEDAHRTLRQKITAHFTSEDKRVPDTMDATGLTSLLYIYDLITDLRIDYLKTYDLPVVQETPYDSYIKRRKIVAAIPRILYDHFPRLYNACLAEGFEKTCGTLFTVILPNPLPGRDDLQPYEMDMMTLVAIFAESIMTRCDRDHDDYLRTQLLDGNDEKTCVLKIAQALVNRLMDARIMDPDPKVSFLVNLVTGKKLFRFIGKAALANGSLEHLARHIFPPLAWVPRPATLGSLISLAAEQMDEDKVKAIKEGVIGPTKDAPGDELIYLNQLSEHYLPSKNKAKRTTMEVMANGKPITLGMDDYPDEDGTTSTVDPEQGDQQEVAPDANTANLSRREKHRLKRQQAAGVQSTATPTPTPTP